MRVSKPALISFAQAAAEHNLFAEKVGFDFVLEGGDDDAGTGAADGDGPSHGDVLGVAGGILLNRDQARDAAAAFIFTSDDMAGALRGDHDDVDVLRGDDGLEVDIETVGGDKSLAGLEVGADLFFEDGGLQLVGEGDEDDVSLLDGLGGLQGLEAGLYRSLVVVRAFQLGDDDVNAAVPAVLSVGVALRAEADDGHGLALKGRKRAVRFFEDFNRHFYLLGSEYHGSAGSQVANHASLVR